MEKLIISATEASGDYLGAHLIRRVRQSGWSGELCGVGGPLMRAEGLRSIVAQEELAVSGFVALFSAVDGIKKAYLSLRKEIAQSRESCCFIAIDSPDFHTTLIRYAIRKGMPSGWLAPPQAWAWRSSRANWLAQWRVPIAVLFPFEEKWFAKRHCRVTWVGHPLVPECVKAACTASCDRDTILLLPGSRPSRWRAQLEWLLPLYRKIVQRDVKERWRQIIVPVAQKSQMKPMAELLRTLAPDDQIEVLYRYDNIELCRAVAISIPGTATLELALRAVPFVVGYRVPRLDRLLFGKLLRVRFFSLPNLILNTERVPETIFTSLKNLSLDHWAESVLSSWEKQSRDVEDHASQLASLLEGDRFSEQIIEWLNGVADGLLQSDL